jgi:hypothetical protein
LEQTLKNIALWTATLAAMSLSACVDGVQSKLQPRPGYSLAFAPDNITPGAVECRVLNVDLARAVPGCKDYGGIIDQQTYDTEKLDEQEIWMSRVPVSCGWLRSENATVMDFPDCFVWVELPKADLTDAAAAFPSLPPAASADESKEQEASNSAGDNRVSAFSRSDSEGESNSASSQTTGVSTAATSSSNRDGTGSFSVDNGHTTMSGTFAADGSVENVSFSESKNGSNSQ